MFGERGRGFLTAIQKKSFEFLEKFPGHTNKQNYPGGCSLL
jgi:hypothetical protein